MKIERKIYDIKYTVRSGQIEYRDPPRPEIKGEGRKEGNVDRGGAHLDHLEIAVRPRRNGAARAISAIKVGNVGGSAASPCIASRARIRFPNSYR